MSCGLQIVGAIAGHEGIDGHGYEAAVALEMAVEGDEEVGVPIVGEVASESASSHADLEIFSEFEVEVGGIHPVIIADRPYFLTATDSLTFLDENGVEMTVEGVDISDPFAFEVGVANDDHIAPTVTEVVGVDNDPSGGGSYGSAEIGIATALAVPIIAEMAIGSHSAGPVIFFPIHSDGSLEAVGESDGGSRLAQERANKTTEKKEKTRPRHWGEGCGSMKGWRIQPMTTCLARRRRPIPRVIR